MKTLRILLATIVLLAIVILIAISIAPAMIESSQNQVITHSPYLISDRAKSLHKTLVVADLHSDSLLWKRNLLERSQRGHVDIPRMREGNQAIQMFTVVTKSPRGQNYQQNTIDAADNITPLVIAQTWPIKTWSSLFARALYQAKKLKLTAEQAPEQLKIIHSQKDLAELLQRRKDGENVVGGLLGTEGSHALGGNLDNIAKLYQVGFRMMSLQHFFDNALGGSLHGESGEGLTEFGQNAVDLMQKQGIMIDIAHSSSQVVKDVLQRSHKPLIVSHTGFYGHCQSERNISDQLMINIAAAGGLIGVGYWDGAVCDISPENVVQAIRYGIELVGVDHVALGSDYDGSVATTFDSSELAILTETMLQSGFSEEEIRKVMGENMVRYLRQNLPVN